MAIQYQFAVDGAILLVRAWGFDESLQDVQAYGMAVIRACHEHGVTSVLCDERDLEYRLSLVDTYEIATFISKNAPALMKAALVCHPRFLKPAQFWEEVAVNRFFHARFFTDPDQALAWLQGTPSKDLTD